jgi:hypothetical protein
MANANIGHIACPITGKLSVVRADCRGKLYFYSEAGKITPNLFTGQTWIRSVYTQWPAPEQPPEGVEVRIIAAGAPPIVTIIGHNKPLTPQPAPVAQENAPPVVTEKRKQKRSALSDFMWGE